MVACCVKSDKEPKGSEPQCGDIINAVNCCHNELSVMPVINQCVSGRRIVSFVTV